MKFLVFELHGAFASWGSHAIGDIRRSEKMPTRSAILGILGAALGISHNETDRLNELEQKLAIAVRQDIAGHSIIDYHTVQTPHGTDVSKYAHSRKEALAIKHATKLTYREYLNDAWYTVAIWEKNHSSEEEHSSKILQSLSEALISPKFTLYLGRRACIPSLPIKGKIVITNTLEEAFSACFHLRDELSELNKIENKSVMVEWEGDPPLGGIKHLLEIERRDAVLDRKRWQFSLRTVKKGSVLMNFKDQK